MAFNPRDFAPLPGNNFASTASQNLSPGSELGSTEYYDPNTAATPALPEVLRNLAATPGGRATINGQAYFGGENGWQAAPPAGSAPEASGWSQPSWLPQQAFQTNPTGIDMIGGTQGLNPRNFATLDTANSLAKQLGGNVVATNYEDATRSPEYNIDFGRGSALNAGQLAYYYGPNSSFAAIRDPAQREAAIRRSIEDELRYNDSSMERQIMADRSGQMGQIQKDVSGGFQSFTPGPGPGGSAPSLSNNSFWNTTGPAGQQQAGSPGNSSFGQSGGAGMGGAMPSPFGQNQQWANMPYFGGGNWFGPGWQQQAYYNATQQPGFGQLPSDAITGFGGNYGGNWYGGNNAGANSWFGSGFGSGGNMQGFAQTMNNVNGMRNAMPYSPQRQPRFSGQGGFGGQSYGNGYYYPGARTGGFGRSYY